MFQHHRSYRTSETFVDRLDAWFGPDAAFWVFLSERLIPALTKMSVAMAGLMLLAAVLHGDPLFATLLIAIVLLLRRLRGSAEA